MLDALFMIMIEIKASNNELGASIRRERKRERRRERRKIERRERREAKEKKEREEREKIDKYIRLVENKDWHVAFNNLFGELEAVRPTSDVNWPLPILKRMLLMVPVDDMFFDNFMETILCITSGNDWGSTLETVSERWKQKLLKVVLLGNGRCVGNWFLADLSRFYAALGKRLLTVFVADNLRDLLWRRYFCDILPYCEEEYLSVQTSPSEAPLWKTVADFWLESVIGRDVSRILLWFVNPDSCLQVLRYIVEKLEYMVDEGFRLPCQISTILHDLVVKGGEDNLLAARAPSKMIGHAISNIFETSGEYCNPGMREILGNFQKKVDGDKDNIILEMAGETSMFFDVIGIKKLLSFLSELPSIEWKNQISHIPYQTYCGAVLEEYLSQLDRDVASNRKYNGKTLGMRLLSRDYFLGMLLWMLHSSVTLDTLLSKVNGKALIDQFASRSGYSAEERRIFFEVLQKAVELKSSDGTYSGIPTDHTLTVAEVPRATVYNMGNYPNVDYPN